MAQYLIQSRTMSDLVNIAAQPARDNPSYLTIDRLLTGAAEESLLLSFLFFRIDGLNELFGEFPTRRIRKLVSELLSLLVKQTPDDVYVDCLGVNEYVLLLPGVSKEDALRAGQEIRQRFLSIRETILKENFDHVELAGCAISFPEDGNHWLELICTARELLSMAGKTGETWITTPTQSNHKTFSVSLSESQLNCLHELAHHDGLDESLLIRKALCDFLWNSN